jgi:wyosine [tRNA(Phe)-imidazoG37] synthetase (radical SAM superfamily)
LEIDEMMRILGAQALADVVLGDDASNLEERFGRWCSQLLSVLTGKAQEAALVADGEVSKRQQKKALRAQEMNQKKQLGGKAGKATAVEAAAARKAAKTAVVKASAEKSAASSGCCGGGAKSAPASNSASSCGCNAPSTTEVNSNTLGLDPGCCSDDEEEEEDIINNTYVTMDHAEAEDAAEELHRKEMEGLLDLEDMGSAMNKTSAEALQHRQAVKDALREGAEGAGVERREMVTKLQRKALTKEGYKIIGTHSAVKICRWTKNQLRGRGGCYKHSFYGITSYQCMEATPSLACANKCVFCWRHHKNPVGTEWRWKEDSPELIVSEAVRLHQGMINEMRGVPGVQAERLQEAFTVRHCALSLVGEPIMYPRINEMLAQLHARDISSFLVTNAQFPEHIRSLDPVTQLYVSVDASTRDSLKAIDRPLFKDFWERFLGSLEELKKKQQRTVYRMTLVKSWNMDQAEGYAELIEQGQPGRCLNFFPRYCW